MSKNNDMDLTKLSFAQSNPSFSLFRLSIILVLTLSLSAMWGSASPSQDTVHDVSLAWELYESGDLPAAEEILLPIALNGENEGQRINASFALGVLYAGDNWLRYDSYVRRNTPAGRSHWDYKERRFDGDVEESAKWFRHGGRLCPDCDRFPQALAELYMGGPQRGRPYRSPEEAVIWARKAANFGNPLGKQILAQLILAGEVKPQKDEEVLSLLEAAIENGPIDPVFSTHGKHSSDILRRMYLTGTGVPKNPEKALSFFNRESHLGTVNHALALVEGIGTEKNPHKAIDLLRPIAEKKLRGDGGSGEIYFVLAEAYRALEEPTLGRDRIYWLKKAAESYVFEAYEQLGRSYLVGDGVTKDEEKARLYLSLAAVNGLKSDLLSEAVTPIPFDGLDEIRRAGGLHKSLEYDFCRCGISRGGTQCNVPFPSFNFIAEMRTECFSPAEYFENLGSFR